MTSTLGGVRKPVRRPLHEGWTVRAVGGAVPEHIVGREIPATVPGSVHTDLLAAGLIADPYLDDNERLLAWVGAVDWEYRSRFEWHDEGHERTDLVFEGLDTIAAVMLNGHPVASTANMHRTYRFDVRELLVGGDNDLIVAFSSPVRHADRASLELGYRPHVNHHPYNAIRKMACSFGWDWGPDLATSGIWRPVTLHSWSGARLASVRPEASIDGVDGLVAVHIEIERAGKPRRVEIEVGIGGVKAGVAMEPDETSAAVRVSVSEAERWWPRGYGDQRLYELGVAIDSGDEWHGRVGFRTVRLDTLPDEHGTGFQFVVNDQPVFVKGANWIPDDAFPHRVTRERYAARIAQAEFAGINLLRVWGGGIFESDDFYELCDERGILTWQDFLFACAAYSEDDPMRSEVLAEARDNVIRLMPHPSLVLWNGNNENIWGFHDWGWEARLEGKDWGLGYYTELIPELLTELDPSRPYTPSSPWSVDLARHPNDESHGSMHLWDLWNTRDYPDYRSYVPRFVAEFGWQGPPTWSTLTEALSDDPLTPESPGMLVHQKALGGNDKLTDGLVPHLPFPGTMEDWHWAMALNQAAALRLGIEHFRSWSPRTAGTVIWQLNDMWPVTSWSAVDGYGRAKPLLYSARHAYADRLVTIQPRGIELVVAIVNDSGSGWVGDLVLDRISFDGAPLATTTLPVSVDARGTLLVGIPADVATAGSAGSEVLVANLDSHRGLWFFADYRDSALAAPALTTEVEAVSDGYDVRVSSAGLVRELSLLVDKLDPAAVVDDLLITLLPGESWTFHVSTAEVLDADELVSPRVLRSANQLVTS